MSNTACIAHSNDTKGRMPKVKKGADASSRAHFAVSPWMCKEDFIIKSDASPSLHRVVEEPLVLRRQPQAEEDLEKPPCIRSESQDKERMQGCANTLFTNVGCHVQNGCIIAVHEDGTLTGRLIKDSSTGPEEPQWFTGTLLETYRDCTRDASWNIALLCFRFTASKHLFVLAEVSGGDELNLKSPVALTDEETKSISSCLGHVSGLDLELPLSFRCELLIDTEGCSTLECQKKLSTAPVNPEFSEPLQSLVMKVDSIAHMNIGYMCLVPWSSRIV